MKGTTSSTSKLRVVYRINEFPRSPCALWRPKRSRRSDPRKSRSNRARQTLVNDCYVQRQKTHLLTTNFMSNAYRSNRTLHPLYTEKNVAPRSNGEKFSTVSMYLPYLSDYLIRHRARLCHDTNIVSDLNKLSEFFCPIFHFHFAQSTTNLILF